MNLKPFDLERALAGDPVVMRDGKKVIMISHFKHLKIVVFSDENHIYTANENGSYTHTHHERDLFMAHKTKKLFIAIEKKEGAGGVHWCTSLYSDNEYLKSEFDNPKYVIKEVEIEI